MVTLHLLKTEPNPKVETVFSWNDLLHGTFVSLYFMEFEGPLSFPSSIPDNFVNSPSSPSSYARKADVFLWPVILITSSSGSYAAFNFFTVVFLALWLAITLVVATCIL